MRMRSVMDHAFSKVPNIGIPRSSFDRSHGYKTTFDAGRLIPFFVDEVLPGDTFNTSPQAFARLATPIFPIMDNLYLDHFFFFVPWRLVWENWERFMGAQDDPDDSTDFLIPQIIAPDAGFVTGTLADYFGLPVGVTGLGTYGMSVTALIFRAYVKIWNEWFRDQNLQDSIPVAMGDSPDPLDNGLNTMPPLPRGKRHDYFTSCLPWPQKGSAVTIPLGTTAPVVEANAANQPKFRYINDPPSGKVLRGVLSTGDVFTNPGPSNDGDPLAWYDPNLVADLSAATAATINVLRQAVAVQQLMEIDARGGTRYTEIVLAHFGVRSPDARLQRPEYLGGGRTNINVVSVPQTSSTDSETPQGNLAAYATATMHGGGFVKSFTEHGVVIGVMCAIADLTYQQGLQRMWSRRNKYEFFWPGLAQIGEQAVLNKEIYAQGTSADIDVFGYQERYGDYRYKPSQLTGLMRSSPTTGTSLDAWHLSIDFGALPELDDVFIEENPPVDRVIAVPSEPQFIIDMYIQHRCARPMPLYGVPGLTRL